MNLPATPRAVLFDAYGTLFDVYSVSALAEELFPRFGERLAALWRDKQIEYTRLVSMSDPSGARYRPFWELTRAGLRYAALRFGLTLTPESEGRLMEQYLHLAAFPENRGVLESLAARGIRAGVLSNGDPGMLGAVVRNAGFADLLNPVLSVDPTRRFKTDPATYALGVQALGVSASEILFVSSNCWDVVGATWFGYTAFWVNRFGLPLEQLDTPPAHTGSGLQDVLHCFRT